MNFKEKKYAYGDVYTKTLKYFNGDEVATNVWITKYCLKDIDKDGNVIYFESNPDDMFHRISHEICRVGLKYKNPLSEEEIFNLISGFKYIIFQGRPMAGIGSGDNVSISNCFVVGRPGYDSYGLIGLIDQQIMQISKRGGGVGTDLSDYRSNGSKVHNAAMTSSGPVEICANRFSNTIREVGQNGRRGALMLSMSINHPNAEEFMDSKMEEGKITGANISLRIFDDWMKSAFGIGCEQDVEKYRIWKKIIHNATKRAEPGILFWDTIIRESIPDCYEQFGFKTLTTNPCGEIPLSNCDSCRLMALNLYSYVKNPFTSEAYFDYDLFANHARKIVKLMDNMIDLELEHIDRIIQKVENDPEELDVKQIEINLWKKIKEVCILGRRAGIGITGEGDMLAAMGYKYGTPTATSFATNIQRFLATNIYIGSCNLVQIDKRPTFECFDYNLEKDNPFLKRLCDTNTCEYNKEVLEPYINELNEKISYGRRNIALLTIAPTGSVSCVTQTTSGIEPVFMVKYSRRRKIDKDTNIKPDFIDKTGDWFINFNILHNKFIVWYSVYKGITFDEAKSELEVMNEDDFNEIYKYSPYYGATAMDCDWKEKVHMQGDMQKYVDHSISVTINLPKGTSEETVDELYRIAWESGCKGCTIYVDGSRDGILITKDKKDCGCKDFLEKDAPKRPKMLPCKLVRFVNNKEKWIAAVGLYEGRPYEIFTGSLEKLNVPPNIDDANIVRNRVEITSFDEDTNEVDTKLRSRYDLVYVDNNGETKSVEGLSTVFNKEYWNYGKLVSGLLRHGMPIQYVIKVISTLDLKDNLINSWKNGVIRALKRFTKDGETDEICPECGAKLWRESGCVTCKSCGWSKCG